ncbi:IQ calmodulin-binding domain-containing protein domain-containing protein [Magnaporthiopsis poae ATCC 64411]|uniref:IQ calmodulin-binding domain-containing protein domain-containing protein n=1 Tax=Magnaporthiopsis poae (strain ATCC 64411 / 73-15) TaxID=644358 RepID=A0A0C4EEX7_MAGP6|nr:IQ calmodulin-binding domain-containing protein domain-containing protein [Magnaporthiopsis poae ATCC 64411]
MLPDVKEESKEADEARPMTPESAARQLQWWWRATIRRRAVAEFQALGLNIDGVRETAFEKVVQLLAQESVLTATSRMLRICGLREGAVGSVSEMAAVRTFLSALLILGHPAQVLSNKDNKGEQEQVGAVLAQPLSKDDLANPQLQELVGKARDLLICFENILPRLTSMNGYTPPPGLKAQLPETYAAFHNTFIAWKARDSGALIDVMLMQFVELDAIWQTVKDSTDPSVTESYRQSIQDNQVMLLVRIKKLAGAEQGKKMVFEAVRKARKSRAETKPSGDTKPREAADYTVETAMGDLGTPEPSEQQRHEDLPAQQESSPSEEAKHMTVRVRIPRNRLLPDNRILVHELSIDKNYRLSAEEYREQQALFLAPLLQRMRDTMQHESQEEEHFRLLLEVAKELRAKLQRLVQQGKSMHTFIGEVLDTGVAYQQFVTGSFSYEKFFSTMGQLLPKLCAPLRDDEVKELVEHGLRNGTYVDRLEALMSFIDVMSSDHANYLLSLVAPQILSSASEYEAKCFAQALERRDHGLKAAEASWRSARGRLLAEAARRDPEGISHPKSRPTPDRIYTQVLVDLFTRLGPISLDDMPETLRLDHRRAVRSGALTRRIVTTGAILLQCKNMLKRDVRVPWRTEAGRIMTVLEAADERRLLKQREGDDSSTAPRSSSESSSQAVVDGVMAALESGRSMPSATKTNLRALVGKMEAAAAESGRTGYSALHFLSQKKKVKAERLAGLGLAEFVDRVRDMVDEISRVGAVDREAHGPWWEAVAENVDKEGGETSSSSSPSSSATASSSR